MWKNLDACAGEKIDRSRPDYAKFEQRTAGENRVCGNDAKAPHNYEGFWLTMGDMLVKAGDPAAARAIYANARHAPAYATWKYKDTLEDHAAHADARAKRYESEEGAMWPAKAEDSAPSCVRCHAR